jgi:hypothetical protein
MFAWKHHGLLAMAVSMVGGAIDRPVVMQREQQSHGPLPLWLLLRCSRTAQDFCVTIKLDNAFFLIEGHPG